MVKGNLVEVNVAFDSKGSLATTYHGHGSDMGLVGGLLDYDLWDENLINSLRVADEKGIIISFEIKDYEASHPNTYRISAVSNQNEQVNLSAISSGGGMIEIQMIDGLPVNIAGDFFETLLFFDNIDESLLREHGTAIEKMVSYIEFADASIKNNNGLINIKTRHMLSETDIKKLYELSNIKKIMHLKPVLPIQSRKNCITPFSNAQEMLNIGITQNLELWELAAFYESIRGNISKEEVFAKMRDIVKIMCDSIEEGLKGTVFEDRILGPQAWRIGAAKKDGKLIRGDVVNTITSYITALMEVKSAMGVIVAAPTAGSCGGLPGTIIGAAKEMDKSIEEMTRAMLASGIIGVFIAEKSGFAAEVGGCQVECGAGSGMAAAGLVQLMGGTVQEGIDAASMALQNVLGMVCDPVGDRVEVPCLGKNVMAGVNAIACANMILSGFDKVIPLDETLTAMDRVGRMIPSELRCTGYGGLSTTETSKNIFKKLNGLA
jgi:L-serine dehydratase